MKSAFSIRRDAAWARGAAAFAAAAFAASALLLAHGCARETRVERRVLIVGIDSADWSLIEPLMAQGKLPHLTKLVESGVSSRLRSLEPRQKSPTIWTSIATGKLPQKHGIGGYVDPTTKNLMTSNQRKVRTVWDILGESKRTVGVIGWLVSWPAEPLNGYMVTDYFCRVPKAGQPFPEKLASPGELASEIDSLRVLPESVSDALVASFADLGAAPSHEEIARLPIGQRLAETRAGAEEMSALVAALRDLIASDRTFFRVARHLMRTRPADVVAVYFRGVDTASHRFWAAAHRGQVPFEVSRTEAAVFGKTMERTYEQADGMLGAIVTAFGDDATIIVCSDHGFDGPKRGQEIGGINDHGPVGILVMAGDGIRRGVKIDEQGVCDITPTILALCGLPVASDMDGEVIEAALTEDFLAAHPVREIASYERSK